MSKHFLEALYGTKLDELPEDVFESKLGRLFEAAAEEEEYQMLANKSPLQKILSAVGISGEVEEKVGCCCVTLPDGEAFRTALKLLSDADVIYKLAQGGWVAANKGDVAMTNEPAEYVLSFLDIAEITASDSDKVPDLNKVIGDAQKAGDAHEQEHDDKLNPVEHGSDKTGGKTTGVGKAKDGSAPEGKIKDSAAALVSNLLEGDAEDGKSPGLAKKPAAKGTPGRPKGLPKDLKKGKKMTEGELPEPPLNEMTSTGSMGTVPSPVGAKEMFEPGRGLETKGSGGQKLGRKFKMPGQWNQKPAIAPKPKKK